MEEISALEKNVAELTVMDVYDIASAVGQEFERVIDQYGCEAIGRLMPKVVRVLEILEVLVSRNINPEMEELRLELDRLRLERMDRIEKEKKHQKVSKGRSQLSSSHNSHHHTTPHHSCQDRVRAQCSMECMLSHYDIVLLSIDLPVSRTSGLLVIYSILPTPVWNRHCRVQNHDNLTLSSL